ncbi:bifunctional DNA primase/polymerase [Streptomyces sp. SP18CS02]|uniref:bifunctional DNA primase/polymerase n=1 Tax=Streptomyces sp. SP18CS02 TaxID=3002531 RepID=UPI002E770D5F|nr:bifunctional DNA primase/polymerase [Streptomyces sp. SP18CS02]MEE1755747.1 bifunctional DNA primase/polymerase [Streptomyces sp. SP18CS02]
MHSVEETIGTTEAAQIPKQRGEQLLDSAVRYAEERHWDVFPGTWLEAVDGEERCSCGVALCATPGAHPARPDWATQATGSAVAARRLWGKHPRASILMPTGRTFDALDVPESAGFLALARMERMELTLGPVTCTPDRRMLFFVLPGAGAKVPDLVRKLGWAPSGIDLVARGEGHYVAAPPTRVGGRGAVQWARRPTPANRWLPDAEELISPLAYACGREAAAARTRHA